jgi:TonB family protein
MRLLAITCLTSLALAQPPAAVRPRLLSRIQPDYSEEARRAGVSTIVTLSIVVNTDGVTEDIKVVRGAGFGLDEKAIQAVSNWRFTAGVLKGVPVPVKVTVELNFRLSVKKHEGQIARLNFDLPSGVAAPELLRGKMPDNPDDPGDASLRIALSVSPDGVPQNFHVIETSSAQWAEDALREIRKWRFRPADRSGPVEVEGVFELTRSVPSSSLPLSQSDPIDPSLPAPKLISPADGEVFDIYPRRTTCQWEVSPGAVSYIVEWDYSYNGVWDAEAKKRPGAGFPVNGTQYTFEFIGAQPGRWRVWPVSATGRRGAPSEWRTFRYTR